MPRIFLLALLAASALRANPVAAQSSQFDGVWGVTISCPAVADATGYTLRFPARVTRGSLAGENGAPGQPGYLRLTGSIQADGSALLEAHGLVGSPRTAIGQLPSLTPYHYTAAARFAGDHGTGNRTSVRPCSLDFVRS
ncbi:MAG: hypothetical protein RQ966_04520 [Acetobacteraceae bacterium]|nr:hypothetical protein [Acetobacteraceae bacterium]